MNILYHHRTQGTGAESVHIAQIVEELRRLGHQTDVISPAGRAPNSGTRAEARGGNPYGRKRRPWSRLLAELSQKSPQLMFEGLELGYNPFAYRLLKKELGRMERLAPGSVTALYERYAFFLAAGARVAEEAKIPYIVEVNELAGEERVRGQVLVPLAKRIERYVFERADSIIVVSDFLKQKIAELGVRESKIVVMPNGVDDRLFDSGIDAGPLRQELGFGADTVVIGFVGWFVGWHHLDLLLEAFATIAKGRDVALLLVGEGELRGKLEAASREHGISGRVVFSGAVTHQQVPQYVSAMDICVIPASNAYRSPIKLFEYLAMAKAVVAPDVPPVTCIVEHGRQGVIFKPDDRADLEDKLRSLVDNPVERAKLGEAGKAKVLNHHLWRHNAEQVVELFNQALERRSGTRDGTPARGATSTRAA